MNFSIIEQYPGFTTVALEGELNAVTAQQFEKDMQSILEETDKDLVLDFLHLDYISSAGLRSILAFQKTKHSQGHQVIIRKMSQDIRKIFKLTTFDRLIKII